MFVTFTVQPDIVLIIHCENSSEINTWANQHLEAIQNIFHARSFFYFKVEFFMLEEKRSRANLLQG